ncbi:Ig-like domain repeat protein [Paenibacillus sp. CC-CFT742]|nr:Ig-like domain repeat protein [Paenibacillus sp. CC-CFT742]WJH28262.1 Ig-like domain repeat protein [Paenibacillus sp. CC-CFT742]
MSNVLNVQKKVSTLLVTVLTVTSASAVYAEAGTNSPGDSASLVSTSITLQSTRSPASETDPVTFVASIHPDSSSTVRQDPTGTVTLKDGDTVIGTASVVNDSIPSRALISVRNLDAGEHQITAEYSGNSTFGGSISDPVLQTVSTTATPPSEHPTVTEVTYLYPPRSGEPFTLDISTKTNPQYYQDIAGTVILMDGDKELAALPMFPKGVSNGHARTSYTISDLSVGDHHITAKYYGDTRFGIADSVSDIVLQVAEGNGTNTPVPTPTPSNGEGTTPPEGNENLFNTTVTIESTRNPASEGEPIAFMARVSRNYNDTYDMPTGTVTFKDGDIVLGTAEVGTDVTKPDLAFYSVRSLSVGDRQITAEYNGNSTFKSSTSAPLTQTITTEAVSATEHPTVTKVNSYLNPSKYGDAVTFYVRAETKPQISRDIAGSVILMDGDTELATLAMWPDGVANGVAKAYFTTSDLSVGDHPITAKYYGDARHGVADSTSEVMVQVVQGSSGTPANPPTVPGGDTTPSSPTTGSSSGSGSTPTAPVTSKPQEPALPGTTEQPSTPEQSEDYQDPNDIFRSRVVNADSNVIAGVQSRIAEILSKGDDFVTLQFGDIQQHWAIPSIEKLTKLGVIKGYPTGGFEPDEQITRAEFAAMINRAFVDMASREVNLNEEDFTAYRDINNRWSTNDLKRLVAVGVLNGYEDGSIRPEKTISRQEMALIITRVLNSLILNIDTSHVQFADLNGAFGADAIRKAAALGIFEGKNERSFDPNGGATRAEAIETILKTYRLSPAIKESLESLK